MQQEKEEVCNKIQEAIELSDAHGFSDISRVLEHIKGLICCEHAAVDEFLRETKICKI